MNLTFPDVVAHRRPSRDLHIFFPNIFFKDHSFVDHLEDLNQKRCHLSNSWFWWFYSLVGCWWKSFWWSSPTLWLHYGHRQRWFHNQMFHLRKCRNVNKINPYQKIFNHQRIVLQLWWQTSMSITTVPDVSPSSIERGVCSKTTATAFICLTEIDVLLNLNRRVLSTESPLRDSRLDNLNLIFLPWWWTNFWQRN